MVEPTVVIVGMYGLNRSGKWTGPSIHKNIITPLRRAGYDVFVVGHFNSPGVINSERSGEFGLAEHSVKHFVLDAYLSETQSSKNISDIRQHVDSLPWFKNEDCEGRISIGFLHQLHSLRRLKEVLVRFDKRASLYLFIRPDLLYLDQVDLVSTEKILDGKVDVITPAWEEWGGLCDRFFFCNEVAATILLDRYKNLERFCKEKNYVHAEHFLDYVVKINKLRLDKTKMRAARVRANGYIVQENYTISNSLSTWLRLISTFRKYRFKVFDV